MRYVLVVRCMDGPETFRIEDPEIRGGYLYAQYIAKPAKRSRMCEVSKIESMTVEPEDGGE